MSSQKNNSKSKRKIKSPPIFPDISINQLPMHDESKNGQKMGMNKRPSVSGTMSTKSSNDLSHLSTSTSPSTNSASTTSTGRCNIWSTMTQRGYMAKTKDAFTDEDDFEYEYKANGIKLFFIGCTFEAKHRLKTAYRNPRIIVYAFLLFLVLLLGSLITVNVVAKNVQQRIHIETSQEAIQTATWFAETFAKSLIPLRSLQQAIIHSNSFKNLPHQIGNYGEEGAAASIYGKKDLIKDYRNITGICDDPDLIREFQDIVEGVNQNFGFEDIIVTYRIAPYGVYCLANPMTVELTDDKTLNSELEMGWDPLHSFDARMGEMLRSIYHEKNSIYMFGPTSDFLGIPGKNIYCGHLAVEMPGYKYALDEEEKSIWGFVMHFIDWSKLKERSGIDEYYKTKEYSYQLTRTDLVLDEQTGNSKYEDVVIAQSQDWPHGHKFYHTNNEPFDDTNSISSSVTTEDSGDWTMHIKTHDNIHARFLYLKLLAVLGSFIIASMLAINLTERQLNKMLLYKIMPREAITKLNRGQTVIERYNIVTIFFCDIVGFTSMCGEMRPIQVMKMLNELYIQFDKIVEKHGVYKVETIGDAYMVVGGAPNRMPAPEAAEKVTLFAIEAMEFVKNFKTTDGDKIFIRAGIASGPTVAGVVGKAMPRYCFFGDTVNFASRMESSSQKMRIQCSDFTYQLLRDAPNFSIEIERRQDIQNLKGKGKTQTWWINAVDDSVRDSDQAHDIESRPKTIQDTFIQSKALSQQDWSILSQGSGLVSATSDGTIMVHRLVAILEYRLTMAMKMRDQNSLSTTAKKELLAYVFEIYSMYNNLHFHGFQHASHVTISMHKLIDSLIESDFDLALTPDVDGTDQEDDINMMLTYDSGSAYFAIVFASLIHDVEHTGQSNKILVATKHKITKDFSWSEAERNSLHVAMRLLSQRKYKNLLKAICPTQKDRIIFGKLVQWAVLSTDIASSERLEHCVKRFRSIYTSSGSSAEPGPEFDSFEDLDSFNEDDIDPRSMLSRRNSVDIFNEMAKPLKLKSQEIKRLSTGINSNMHTRVAIEHLQQVADVAHVMQNWENFLKWNFRLYKELMECHTRGLMPDPSNNWSEGQIDFISQYVLPLARRTESIFEDSVSKLNLVQNAEANLKHWKKEGNKITGIFVSGYQSNDCESDILRDCLLEEGFMV